MHVYGFGGPEMIMILFTLVLQVAIIAAVLFVFYWIIRKAVCAGMEDFEKKKSNRGDGRPAA